MKSQATAFHDNFDDPLAGDAEVMEASESDLWFLPGPIDADHDDLPPGRRADPARLQFSTTGGGLKRVMPHASPASQVGLARWMIGCGVGRRAGGTGSLSLKRPT